MSEWRISRQGRECSVCGKAFAPEEDFVSAIYETSEEALFDRLDAHADCFGRVRREPYSRWTTRLPSDRGKGPILDLDMALQFLVRLAREASPERGPLMHILALLLLRKRRVKLLARRVEPGGPVMDLACRQEGADETITVPAREPSEEETVDLEREVGRLFGT